MKKIYYKKSTKINFKNIFKVTSLSTCVFGIFIILYIFFPLISWQVYFAPVFASQKINLPIPQSTLINSSSVKNLIAYSAKSLTNNLDYTNAKNWFPQHPPEENKPNISSYSLSIPKLNIKEAKVTTIDYDLAKHLVNYGGTAIPPENGTAVIFGHSTLPQLFNPKDYKTIFATLHTLKVGDQIFAAVENVTYSYRIYNIIIVDPKDTEEIFAQRFDSSYIALITCTPPGTIWKRLVIKAKLERI